MEFPPKYLGPLIQISQCTYITKYVGINIMIHDTCSTFRIDYCYDPNRCRAFLKMYCLLSKLFEHSEFEAHAYKCYSFTIKYPDIVEMRLMLKLQVEHNPLRCFFSDYHYKPVEGQRMYDILEVEKYCYYNSTNDNVLEIANNSILISWDKPEKEYMKNLLESALEKYSIQSNNHINGINIYMLSEVNSRPYYIIERVDKHTVRQLFEPMIIIDIISSTLQLD